jgi:hypothetical protein
MTIIDLRSECVLRVVNHPKDLKGRQDRAAEDSGSGRGGGTAVMVGG